MKVSMKIIEEAVREALGLAETEAAARIYILSEGDKYDERVLGYFLTEEEARQALQSLSPSQHEMKRYIKVEPLGKLIDPTEKQDWFPDIQV